MRFKDRITIVTGGATGIGQAIAQGFAQEGAMLVILDKLEDEARDTVGEITSLGGKAAMMRIDATKGQQVKEAVDIIAEKWGRIDILVNNIGLTIAQPFLETHEEDWVRDLDVNLLVPLRFCHAVLPYMINQNYGRIVNIASNAGRQPRPGALLYGAAKAGVISMTKSLAVAMAPHNIRVNAVCPGATDTPRLQQTRRENPAYIEYVIEGTPLGRLGEPKEIAAMVMFLASDDASYVQGQSISVCGGNLML